MRSNIFCTDPSESGLCEGGERIDPLEGIDRWKPVQSHVQLQGGEPGVTKVLFKGTKVQVLKQCGY